MQSILVVDDSPVFHSMFRAMLKEIYCAATIRVARNGVDALAQIEQDGEPQLVLVDINMPVMDGLEFIARFKDAGGLERVPVVIVSTESDRADVDRGLNAGAKAYLRKPFTVQQLRETLEQATAK